MVPERFTGDLPMRCTALFALLLALGGCETIYVADMPPPREPAPVAVGPGEYAVYEAQGFLRKTGHRPGPIDGLLGPLTAAGIERFEREAGLEETGSLSPELDAAIRAAFDAVAFTAGPLPEALAPSYGAPVQTALVDLDRDGDLDILVRDSAGCTASGCPHDAYLAIGDAFRPVLARLYGDDLRVGFRRTYGLPVLSVTTPQGTELWHFDGAGYAFETRV